MGLTSHKWDSPVTPGAGKFLTPDFMPPANPKLSDPRPKAVRAGAARRRIWRAKRNPRSLTVEVLVELPPDEAAAAAVAQILKGIHGRAELEARERPELDRARVEVHRLARGCLQAGGAGLPVLRPLDAGDRRGSLLIYPFGDETAAAFSRRAPTVLVLDGCPGLEIDGVCADETGAFSSLVGCLRAAGHSRIGFLSGRPAVRGSGFNRRLGGYLHGLEIRGLEFRRERVVSAGRDSASASQEASEAAAEMTRGGGVTAWVCADDHQAYQFIECLQHRGLRVPQDCSVAGFGALEAPTGLPRATSVAVPHEHIGSSALTRMLNRILYPSSPPRRILVGATIVPGETVSAPRSS